MKKTNKYPTNYSKSKPAFSRAAMGITGVTIAEIAVLGAAGYVLWKNRSKIFNLLEQNGIEIPEALTGSFSSLVQHGVSYVTGSKQENSISRFHDA